MCKDLLFCRYIYFRHNPKLQNKVFVLEVRDLYQIRYWSQTSPGAGSWSVDTLGKKSRALAVMICRADLFGSRERKNVSGRD